MAQARMPTSHVGHLLLHPQTQARAQTQAPTPRPIQNLVSPAEAAHDEEYSDDSESSLYHGQHVTCLYIILVLINTTFIRIWAAYTMNSQAP